MYITTMSDIPQNTHELYTCIIMHLNVCITDIHWIPKLSASVKYSLASPDHCLVILPTCCCPSADNICRTMLQASEILSAETLYSRASRLCMYIMVGNPQAYYVQSSMCAFVHVSTFGQLCILHESGKTTLTFSIGFGTTHDTMLP